jgi:pyruvate,water dikinase
MSAAGGPLPVPDHFPFEWPDPEHEALHWTWDQMHHPHPKTPLSATFEMPAYGEGSSRGFQAIQIPMQFHVACLNYYAYNASEFLEETTGFPPAWWPNVEAEFVRRLPGLTQTWEQEYLPEVMAMNVRLRDADYAAMSIDDLLAFIDQTFALRTRAWDIHMQAVMPVMGAAGRFAEAYENLVGAAPENEPYLMLGGFENKTVESGVALWRVGRIAAAVPGLARTIAETPVEALATELQSSPAGAAVWAEFERYLEQYGWRSGAFELADPAWIEDPCVPLTTLREYVQAPDGADPALHEQRARVERERLIEETNAMLDGHEGRPLFDMLLGVAQQYLPIQENHNFYIDQMNTVLTRKPFLDLGRRLAEAGTLAERDDIFFLTYEELPEIARDPRGRDWAALVAERRAERERWSAVLPPRELGTPPPIEAQGNPLTEAFFGKRPELSKDPQIINGIAASAGTVTAPARIVRTLDQAGKVQPGDVLVCEMTMPAWTPLFATVSAVVADSGGVLSHCAIVAREYGIPCVVGTQVGTQTLKDGQRITVDGAQGIVRIEG